MTKDLLQLRSPKGYCVEKSKLKVSLHTKNMSRKLYSSPSVLSKRKVKVYSEKILKYI